jgi:hypothetical protein
MNLYGALPLIEQADDRSRKCLDQDILLANRHHYEFGSTRLDEDEAITVGGTHGVISAGELKVRTERPTQLVARVRQWQAIQPG